MKKYCNLYIKESFQIKLSDNKRYTKERTKVLMKPTLQALEGFVLFLSRNVLRLDKK